MRLDRAIAESAGTDQTPCIAVAVALGLGTIEHMDGRAVLALTDKGVRAMSRFFQKAN